MTTTVKLIAQLGGSGGGEGTVTSVNGVNPVAGAVTIAKSDIGLGSVDNTADSAKPVSTAQAAAIALKAPLASPAFTGTPTGITKTHVGLPNVDNTSDANKPVSTAAQAALDLKAPLASPAFTGTPTGITKTHVGLGNVDNTSDANKPVSTAQATAIAAKADDSAVVHQTESVLYTRTYSSGAFPVRGTVPSSSKVEWFGPVPPPINGTYALTGVDVYTVTAS